MQAIAVLPQGLEGEGSKELSSLGARSVQTFRGTVAFEADMSCLYRLYLQARLPFRLLREMARFRCSSPKDLYMGVQTALDWEHWLHPSRTFRVDVTGISRGLTHSHFTALQVKNAVVDLQRRVWGQRSSINLEKPDLCLHIHLTNGSAVLSLDGSTSSLHRRGYRAAVGIAPLKENLAAGLISSSSWDGTVPLVDPLCGSGTFLIEAVCLALGRAPGLHRALVLKNWFDFDHSLWAIEEDRARDIRFPIKDFPVILGCEQDLTVANQAKFNISSAGLERYIKVQTSHFQDLSLPKSPGVIVCNPPYGKRLGANENLSMLYKELGLFLKQKASGWQLWLLSGNPALTINLGMKASRRLPISNGGIDCRWLNYLIR